MHWLARVWPVVQAALPAMLVWVVFAAFSQTPLGQRMEWLVFDALSVVSAPDPARVRSTVPIVIVGIDEASFAEIDQPWPWPRSLHARLIEQLKAAGARVIAFDVLFAEPTQEEQDQALAEAIRRAGNVLLAADLAVQEREQYQMAMQVEPVALLREAGAWTGLASISLDPDMVVRAIPQDSQAFWRQAMRLYGAPPRPATVAERKLARFLGPDHTYRYVSYYQALDPGRFLPPGIFANQLVLVGYDSKAALGVDSRGGEAYATPFSARSGFLSPGVELHATFIANALSGDGFLIAPLALSVGFMAAALLLMGVIGRDWRPGRGALVGLAMMAGAVCGSYWLFTAWQIWFPVAATLLAIVTLYVVQVAYAFLRERITRRRLRNLFARYVSPNLVDYLVNHPESLRLGGVRRECSFVFTDLAGFTSLMEGIAPEAAVSLLNDYLDQMVAIAFQHDGTLDRVVGDAVAIMFSAPVVQSDHQQRALHCALAMQDFSARYAQQARARGIAFGMTRIGVHSGEVTVGNFGGKAIFDYRALGDPVNTAARLESVNKHLGTRICLSEATVSGCPDAVVRPVGRLVLKGKAKPVMVYEPILATGNGPAIPDTAYEAAYAALERNAPEVLEQFRALAEIRPDDGLVQFHLHRLEMGQRGCEVTFSEK